MTSEEYRRKAHADDMLRATLLSNLKTKLPELKVLLAEIDDHWGAEDLVYRFYHDSFKVYRAQMVTETILVTLESLLPGRALHPYFLTIVREGTGQHFELAHNQDWLKNTRPIVEALFHACHLLKLACRYAEQLSESPNELPSGWATLLYLFQLR